MKVDDDRGDVTDSDSEDYDPSQACGEMRATLVQRGNKKVHDKRHCELCHDNFPHKELENHFRKRHPGSKVQGQGCTGEGCEACRHWKPRGK